MACFQSSMPVMGIFDASMPILKTCGLWCFQARSGLYRVLWQLANLVWWPGTSRAAVQG